MGFALEDNFGPVVLGEWYDFDRRRVIVFLQGGFYVRRDLERVDAKEEATVVKDLERIGRYIRGHGRSESFGEVDHQSGRRASTLLWILGEGGYS